MAEKKKRVPQSKELPEPQQIKEEPREEVPLFVFKESKYHDDMLNRASKDK